uniref:BAG family molecular chaperone regulator 7 n=1 Tax=Erigeron canadensis TaxID=72917 RepID=UPI001CB914EB|nr:BAG family molecular chaperone regulator 7 [Erigeron canadensis]
MSRFTKLDIIDYLVSTTPSPLPSDDFDFDSPLDLFAFPSLDDIIFSPPFLTVTDLVQIHRTTTPLCIASSRNLITRRRSSDLYLKALSDRVSALELAFDLVNDDKKPAKSSSLDRKYTWTAEINSPEKNGLDRKYKVTTEIKGGKKKEKTSKWTAEIKKKGEDVRKYTFTASTANAGVEDSESQVVKKEKNNNKKTSTKKKEKSPRIVEIQGEPDHGALLLKQAFNRALERNKGKKKELSPQDAAMVIQMTFRAYLIKRSQTLRALRDLAVAKGRLKELRSLFNNFSYRRRLAHNAQEKQKFSEKVIVLLITVDSIEGADIMVRAAKRSMVDELEAMLDVVDPQPGEGRSVSLKRRTFDMPDAVIQKELAEGVAQVVRMLGEDNASETFEA